MQLFLSGYKLITGTTVTVKRIMYAPTSWFTAISNANFMNFLVLLTEIIIKVCKYFRIFVNSRILGVIIILANP